VRAGGLREQPADLRAYLSAGAELPKGPLRANEVVAVDDMIFCGTPDAAHHTIDAPLRKALLGMRQVLEDDTQAADVFVVVDAATHVAAHRLAAIASGPSEVPTSVWFDEFGDRSPVVLPRSAAREIVDTVDADVLAE